MEAGTKKKVKRGCFLIFLLAFGFAVWFYGPLVKVLWDKGFIKIGREEKVRYEGDSIANLRAMRTALLSYEESEGQFPYGNGWMDAISNRLTTDVLKQGESVKKMIAPEYRGQEGKFGYAFNDLASGKYHDDVKDKKVILVFESTATEKNAHGDPAKMRKTGGIGITLDGQIVKQ